MKCLSCEKVNPSMVVYCQQCGAYLSYRSSVTLEILRSMILGALLTALFYIGFLPWVEQASVQKLFSGHVSETITALSFCALFMVAFKFRDYQKQKRAHQAFKSPAIHHALEEGIVSDGVENKLQQLSQVLKKQGLKRFQNSLIFKRLRRVLHAFESSSKKEQAHQVLDYQAQIDFARMENSYSTLNLLIWAIPILGFIGTVFGIGESVGEFSTFIRSVESKALASQIRSALGGVTQGLSVAFNTTFLALICVIPIMMLTSFLRRMEEELLLQVEEYFLENILPKLYSVNSMAADNMNEQLFQMSALSEKWMEQLTPVVSTVSDASKSLKFQVNGLQSLTQNLSDSLLDQQQRFQEHQQKLYQVPGNEKDSATEVSEEPSYSASEVSSELPRTS